MPGELRGCITLAEVQPAEGVKLSALLTEAHEAQTERVAKVIKAASTSDSSSTFSKTARAAILAGAGVVGRACKLAFSYELELNPAVTAKFLAKLTLKANTST